MDAAAGSIASRVDRRPLELLPLGTDAAWSRRLEVWTWGFVALGIALRVGRYLLRFPLWGDELMLAGSFLDRDYADLLRPLDSNMVAPLLFLWIELTAVKLGGFSEWTLRLFPLVSGIVGMVLFRHTASQLVRGVPLLLAVAIFAVSYYPIRHASELRAYSSDLTVALLLATFAVEWWRDPARSRWMWALAAFAPVAVGLSYPAAFVAGGLTLGLAWHVWKFGSRSSQAAFVVYNVALVAGFVVFMKLAFAAQYAQSGPGMTRDWADSFPPVAEPGRLLVWLAATFTGETFGYPFGSDRGGSTLTTLACIAGAIVLWRHGQKAIIGSIVGLCGTALIAAALHRYPFGGERCTQYLVPFICLLAGVGGGWAICRARSSQTQRRLLFGTATTFALIGVGLGAAFALVPYKHREDQIHRAFAQWFWQQVGVEADVVCLHTDERRDFQQDKQYQYLCFQRIYSPRHHRGETLTTADSAGRLRCVTFRKAGQLFDPKLIDGWLAEMASERELVDRQTYRVQLNIPRMPEDVGIYEVFEFVPKGTAATAELARRPSR